MDADAPPPPPPQPPVRRRGWKRGLAVVVLGVLSLLALGFIVLDTPIGHRLVADRIASFAPRSGLRIEVGRIERSVFGEAVFQDVTFSDPRGVFARVPRVELDWRPLNWFTSGLDVRRLVFRRGTLLRAPHLRPGDPNAPILPNFDIRIDHLQVDGLTVAKGVLGERRRVDLLARADIRDGRALLRVQSRLGGGDRLFALIDAEPDGDRFDIDVDYSAPKGGLLAGLAGAKQDLSLRIVGDGLWHRWNGAVLAMQDGTQLAALRLTNRAGRYGVLGQLRPDGFLTGLPARAAGEVVSLKADGTFVNSVLDGRLLALGRGLQFTGNGTIDLGRNRFRDLRLGAVVSDPALLGSGTRLDGARAGAVLDGAFRDLDVAYTVNASRIAFGTVVLQAPRGGATASYDGTRWQIPLDLAADRIVTGNAAVDPGLVKARATGLFRITGSRVSSDDIAIATPRIAARLVLRGDTRRGGYGLAGAAAARGWQLANLGEANADAKLVLGFGRAPWLLRVNFAGHMTRVANATLTSIAGTGIRGSGSLSMGGARPLLIERASLTGSKLRLALAGRYAGGGTTTLNGNGRHTQYGPFRFQAALGGAGPRAELLLADPMPAAELKDVRIALAPITDGFRIDTSGGSMLGPFNGRLGLFVRSGGPTRIEVERLQVANTNITGSLNIAGGGATGQLRLAGGGVNGVIGLAPRGGGQGFDLALAARDAHFGGQNPITIGVGRLEANGLFATNRSTIAGNAYAQGLARGSLFIGRFAANARLVNGRGQITASLAGRRGSRFALQTRADVAPGQIAIAANGDLAGRPITMPRRAVFSRAGDGWRLAPTQVNFNGGKLVVSGISGSSATEMQLAMSAMPLSLADIFVGDLGLGGVASGLVDYRKTRGGVATGNARLLVRNLTRSGLVLTSRPVDLALVSDLRRSELETRAVVREGGAVRGRIQARISGLPAVGGLGERLIAGRLLAQMRYNGPADALWRLAALEQFDLTGPLNVAADARGSVADPVIRGQLSSDDLRLQSTLTGTDITGISVRGSFSGSRLELVTFAGKTANGGRVSGQGSFDLSGTGQRGVGMDLRMAAIGARVLSRPDMAATVSGPLRITSDGTTGTIAGRVEIESARWQLGRAAGAEELPQIPTREINRGADIAPVRPVRTTWRYLIDARGNNRVAVRGLGLDSEWSADIRLRGTTAAPRILGRAQLIRGEYEFAGSNFELTRGRINFDGNSPPNPRLDIAAETEETGLTVRIAITGTSARPEINLTSTPPLPEEEVLSRLLFGSSISDISAPEALQLTAAVASLRGGGGLDPINKLRTAIGLDRLRIVSADPTIGRGTGVAVGKYFGRRFYTEIITDTRGYSATQLEFRVTNWLSLLASISTIGRESLDLKASKDY